jgi:hypothetical protein
MPIKRVGSPEIFQRDDGKWSIGWRDDAPGPFESRRHAEAIATRSTGDPPKRRRGARQGTPSRNANPPRLYCNKYSGPAALAIGNSAPLEAACWYAVGADSLVAMGRTRLEAAKASGARS